MVFYFFWLQIVIPDPTPEGLTTPAIVGIAVGSVVAAVALILVNVCAAKSCLGSSKSVEPMMVAENNQPIPFKETLKVHEEEDLNVPGKI